MDDSLVSTLDQVLEIAGQHKIGGEKLSPNRVSPFNRLSNDMRHETSSISGIPSATKYDSITFKMKKEMNQIHTLESPGPKGSGPEPQRKVRDRSDSPNPSSDFPKLGHDIHGIAHTTGPSSFLNQNTSPSIATAQQRSPVIEMDSPSFMDRSIQSHNPSKAVSVNPNLRHLHSYDDPTIVSEEVSKNSFVNNGRIKAHIDSKSPLYYTGNNANPPIENDYGVASNNALNSLNSSGTILPDTSKWEPGTYKLINGDWVRTGPPIDPHMLASNLNNNSNYDQSNDRNVENNNSSVRAPPIGAAQTDNINTNHISNSTPSTNNHFYFENSPHPTVNASRRSHNEFHNNPSVQNRPIIQSATSYAGNFHSALNHLVVAHVPTSPVLSGALVVPGVPMAFSAIPPYALAQPQDEQLNNVPYTPAAPLYAKLPSGVVVYEDNEGGRSKTYFVDVNPLDGEISTMTPAVAAIPSVVKLPPPFSITHLQDQRKILNDSSISEPSSNIKSSKSSKCCAPSSQSEINNINKISPGEKDAYDLSFHQRMFSKDCPTPNPGRDSELIPPTDDLIDHLGMTDHGLHRIDNLKNHDGRLQQQFKKLQHQQHQQTQQQIFYKHTEGEHHTVNAVNNVVKTINTPNIHKRASKNNNQFVPPPQSSHQLSLSGPQRREPASISRRMSKNGIVMDIPHSSPSLYQNNNNNVDDHSPNHALLSENGAPFPGSPNRAMSDLQSQVAHLLTPQNLHHVSSNNNILTTNHTNSFHHYHTLRNSQSNVPVHSIVPFQNIHPPVQSENAVPTPAFLQALRLAQQQHAHLKAASASIPVPSMFKDYADVSNYHLAAGASAALMAEIFLATTCRRLYCLKEIAKKRAIRDSFRHWAWNSSSAKLTTELNRRIKANSRELKRIKQETTRVENLMRDDFEEEKRRKSDNPEALQKLVSDFLMSLGQVMGKLSSDANGVKKQISQDMQSLRLIKASAMLISILDRHRVDSATILLGRWRDKTFYTLEIKTAVQNFLGPLAVSQLSKITDETNGASDNAAGYRTPVPKSVAANEPKGILQNMMDFLKQKPVGPYSKNLQNALVPSTVERSIIRQELMNYECLSPDSNLNSDVACPVHGISSSIEAMSASTKFKSAQSLLQDLEHHRSTEPGAKTALTQPSHWQLRLASAAHAALLSEEELVRNVVDMRNSSIRKTRFRVITGAAKTLAATKIGNVVKLAEQRFKIFSLNTIKSVYDRTRLTQALCRTNDTAINSHFQPSNSNSAGIVSRPGSISLNTPRVLADAQTVAVVSNIIPTVSAGRISKINVASAPTPEFHAVNRAMNPSSAGVIASNNFMNTPAQQPPAVVFDRWPHSTAYTNLMDQFGSSPRTADVNKISTISASTSPKRINQQSPNEKGLIASKNYIAVRRTPPRAELSGKVNDHAGYSANPKSINAANEPSTHLSSAVNPDAEFGLDISPRTKHHATQQSNLLLMTNGSPDLFNSNRLKSEDKNNSTNYTRAANSAVNFTVEQDKNKHDASFHASRPASTAQAFSAQSPPERLTAGISVLSDEELKKQTNRRLEKNKASSKNRNNQTHVSRSQSPSAPQVSTEQVEYLFRGGDETGRHVVSVSSPAHDPNERNEFIEPETRFHNGAGKYKSTRADKAKDKGNRNWHSSQSGENLRAGEEKRGIQLWGSDGERSYNHRGERAAGSINDNAIGKQQLHKNVKSEEEEFLENLLKQQEGSSNRKKYSTSAATPTTTTNGRISQSASRNGTGRNIDDEDDNGFFDAKEELSPNGKGSFGRSDGIASTKATKGDGGRSFGTEVQVASVSSPFNLEKRKQGDEYTSSDSKIQRQIASTEPSNNFKASIAPTATIDNFIHTSTYEDARPRFGGRRRRLGEIDADSD